MIEISLYQLVVFMGVPSAVTGFCFWLLQRRITKRDAERAKQEEERRQREKNEADARRKALEEREQAHEDLELLIVQSTSAAIALAEATARAVQRIPDAHCNGDMHAALDYAATVKHAQKEFLQKQGIAAIFDS